MAKKSVSTRLPQELVEKVDKICNNRSNLIANALIQHIKDPQLIENEIDRRKQERQDLIDRKHEIENEIEEKRDEIRDLESMKTEMKTFNKVKKQIPETELENVRDTVRQNKYDADPRAMKASQVIEHNAKRISADYDIQKEKVKTVLRLTTEV